MARLGRFESGLLHQFKEQLCQRVINNDQPTSKSSAMVGIEFSVRSPKKTKSKNRTKRKVLNELKDGISKDTLIPIYWVE